MLRLKKLQIQGFKSFCDRTELHFSGNGVVGVVGPNGCGKSNLADAISWVLGEQSAKSLRGGRMEDVIFAGTRDRPATGMAEVSLTLIDPQEYDFEAEEPEEAAPEPVADGWDDEETAAEGEQPAAETPGGEDAAARGVVLTIRKRRKFVPRNRRGEVMVTRRLYRSGDSEYLMNGRLCRLRDIQELFMGTGLGPESYAIIEQGRIGQILSSKPYDRRAVIEEAAGVSKYKAKRRQAEARLEASKLNLSRINDIFEEVTRQVGSLKRQAAKAERYKRLKADFDRQQRQLLWRRAEALQAALTAAREKEAAARQAVQTAQQAVAAAEAELAEARGRDEAMEQQLRATTADVGRLKREAEQARQQIGFQRQQSAEFAQRGQALGEEAGRLDEQRTGLVAELEQAAKEQDAAGELAAAARAAFAERQQQHQAALEAVRELEQRLDGMRRETLQHMSRTAQLGNQLTQDETLIGGLERQLERLQAEAERAAAELAAGGERRGQLALAFQDQESELKTLAARVVELERRAAELKTESAHEQSAAQQARTELAAMAARQRSLEEIVAHHGYSSEAVRRLFTPGEAPEGFEPLGVLGEFLEVEAPYDRVLEQFLHDELNYVVVRSWDQADAGVGLLRAQEHGRATFLVHDGAHAAEAAPGAATETRQASGAGWVEPNPVSEPGLVPLLGEVKALNGFRQSVGTMLPKLRQAYQAADAAQAQRLARQHPAAYFLTPRGECFHNLTVTGGAGASSGPLSLKRELRELGRRQEAETAALTRREERLELLGRDLETATQELEQSRARRHELDKQLLTSSQAVRQVENEVQRAQAALERAQLETERARAERQQAEERRRAAREEMDAVSAALAGLEQREQEAGTAADEARTRREAAAQAMSAAQAEGARIEERARAAAAAADRLRRQSSELDARLEQVRAEAALLAERRETLLAQAAALELGLAQLDADCAAATQAEAQQEAALAAARERAHQMEAELAGLREQLETHRAAHNECEVGVARLEADLEHLRQTCRDDLDCELEALGEQQAAARAAETAETAEAAEAPPELPALEESVRALRQRLDQIGPVNMMALEEYEETRERHAFMETQRKDLLDSIADTQKAIQEMDTISRQKFREAFEQINANFQEMFQVLFGGGQGFLRMSETAAGEDPGDGGVDIVAQPPGKKLQNALLLSGGEKAMTAMALLLAVFRYQPSPFCLLDEVDAPMDEANVIRFSNMVREMSQQTQFIMITHNKRTMEAAPTLYGVTMPQAGVSRLVSVMVEEAQRAAAS